MRTAAILPVKRFPLAKQRLGRSIADSLRADLARAMVGDVLSALRECDAIDATIVVTCEPSVASAARYIGALVVEDTAEASQSAAASLGLAHALREGFERALCVPGDCPTLNPEELTELLRAGVAGGEESLVARALGGDVDAQFGAPHAHAGDTPPEQTDTSIDFSPPHAHAGDTPSGGGDMDIDFTPPHAHAGGSPISKVTSEVVIVPDRHGKGTNGLLLCPPDALSPSFGPDSRARHERLAIEGGVAWRIAQPASLLLDIDTGEDLEVLCERLAGEHVRAPRTRAVLARTGADDHATTDTDTEANIKTNANANDRTSTDSLATADDRAAGPAPTAPDPTTQAA
jgi:2-phospho-L-lactate guanylyltransferase (CobY/MobA/RfbA family)